MEFEPTAIPEVVLIKPQVFKDARGHFFESWTEAKFAAGGLDLKFVQDNENRSEQHVLRGLHYQLTKPQGKLVRVVTGAVFDVAVDLRRRSPTFGRSVGAHLTADNHHMLWVPPGFGHGFMVMSESVHFLYKCTQFYYPQDERAIRWDDADLGVKWPLPAGIAPVISARDAAARAFRDAEYYP
ncbi:MAG TPA: dTDP-4-dehydrorhamnose 3,5-epimerase [Steroidobacteraceae bacterium]|nr:dTDP-4-dehydrorhamnose 3,5-epimerase [Steroidobacteraceae bacterium]